MSSMHRSRRVSEMRPDEKLFAAISILQAHILAKDTALIPEKLFA